jgi:hypothetical protein
MDRLLSKSKLLASRQCSKRIWLEVHRPDLLQYNSESEATVKIGDKVGEVARRLYDPERKGVLVDPQIEGFAAALDLSSRLLESSEPIFEAGFAAEGALAFVDVMVPAGEAFKGRWRMVEVKASTKIRDYHRDDIAIQAFVALAAGVSLATVAVAHIDSDWVYPGEGNYEGLLVESDMTTESLGRREEVKLWIDEAQAVVGQDSEPKVCTGDHCSSPFSCGFLTYCKGQEPQAEFPVEWLPRQSKAVKDIIATKAITDLRDVPDEYLNDLQRRVKAQTISNTLFFDAAGAASELAMQRLPAYFLDFETIQFAVPIWKGTRPYQQVPFQFSLHRMENSGAVDHCEFLDILPGRYPAPSKSNSLSPEAHFKLQDHRGSWKVEVRSETKAELDAV